MTIRGRILAALLAVLGRPTWWILALAGFLVRGGILLFLGAIVTLPSPLALANAFGPVVTSIYFGRIEPTTLVLLVSALGFVVAWIALGSWIGAATEVVLIRDARQAAIDEGLPAGPERSGGRLLITRSALAHLLAHVPLLAVAGLASIPITAAVYRELVTPSDAGPIVLRVIAGAAGPVSAIALALILGEIVGGIAVRRIVLLGESVVGAVVRAAADLVRRPLAFLVAPLVQLAILAIDVAAVLLVVVLVWTEVRDRLTVALEAPLATGLALATLGAAWSLALVVTGLIDAWRGVALTFEVDRVAALAAAGDTAGAGGGSGAGAGTMGASTHRRPGDWSADDRGGSL